MGNSVRAQFFFRNPIVNLFQMLVDTFFWSFMMLQKVKIKRKTFEFTQN